MGLDCSEVETKAEGEEERVLGVEGNMAGMGGRVVDGKGTEEGVCGRVPCA